MDLAPVVAATAAAQGLVMCRDGETWTFFEIDPEVVRIARDDRLFWFCRDPRLNDFVNDYRANAELAALARSAADLGDLPSRECWHEVRPNPKIAGWTDDYSASRCAYPLDIT
jgi:hypothetical protein